MLSFLLVLHFRVYGVTRKCVCGCAYTVCVYPALLITKATGILDDTSTSSNGGGERLEKAIYSVIGTQPGCTGRNVVCQRLG